MTFASLRLWILCFPLPLLPSAVVEVVHSCGGLPAARWELGAWTQKTAFENLTWRCFREHHSSFRVPWHVEEAVSTHHVITRDNICQWSYLWHLTAKWQWHGERCYFGENVHLLHKLETGLYAESQMLPKRVLSLIYSQAKPGKVGSLQFQGWNIGELCLCWSVLLCEMCRQQCCTSVRLVISPSSGVCIRGFLCHVMVSWLWEAFCSATLQPIHLFCQAWNPAVSRRTKWVWEIPSAGICTLREYSCFAYSSVEPISLVRSCNLYASSSLKNSKLGSWHYLAKLPVELHNFISDHSIYPSVSLF